MRRPRIPKPETRGGRLVELVLILAIAVGVALALQAWVVKPYRIPSGSMEPTLDVGQRVLVNRFVYDFEDPQVGDIVVFHPPAGADVGNECGVQVKGRWPEEAGEACPRPTAAQSSHTLVKRIVAGPGDTLSIRDGHPVLNGVEKADEPYVTPAARCPPATCRGRSRSRRTTGS